MMIMTAVETMMIRLGMKIEELKCECLMKMGMLKKTR